MTFHLSEILKIVGPGAAIVFAAWIFMGFLQQRYDHALTRYTGLIEDYRSKEMGGERRDNVRDQIKIYRKRCRLMSSAILEGLVSAVLLILSLILAEAEVVVPGLAWLPALGALTVMLGFLLVILSAFTVLIEGRITHRQLDSEVLDVADLAKATGLKPGGR